MITFSIFSYVQYYYYFTVLTHDSRIGIYGHGGTKRYIKSDYLTTIIYVYKYYVEITCIVNSRKRISGTSQNRFSGQP